MNLLSHYTIGDAIQNAGILEAANVYTDSKEGYFTRDLINVRELCSATLIVSNGVLNSVVLRPLGKSEFAYDVLVDRNIISKGSIKNYNENGDNRVLNITSASDLNLYSTNNDVNINAGDQIRMFAPSTIINNDALIMTIHSRSFSRSYTSGISSP